MLAHLKDGVAQHRHKGRRQHIKRYKWGRYLASTVLHYSAGVAAMATDYNGGRNMSIALISIVIIPYLLYYRGDDFHPDVYHADNNSDD